MPITVMKIDIASAEKDFKGIRRIWEERFTTDQTYLNTIFQRIFPFCRSYICIENNEIISAISLLPMRFHSPGLTVPLKGFYLFGVATLEKATGRHLAATLINHASAELTTEGYDFIFERPANQSLNSYYLKLGFSISLKKLPYRFKFTCNSSSTGNNHRISIEKRASEAILEELQIEFPKRFEWENLQILEGLIALGELKEHISNPAITTNEEETYIAVKSLKPFKQETFQNTFFCFPME